VRCLADIPEVTLFQHTYDSVIPHIFPIRVDKAVRAELREFLSLRDIETGLHYYPNHKLTLFNTSPDNCPNVETIGDELITLPLHVDLTASDIERVVSTIKYFFSQLAKNDTKS